MTTLNDIYRFICIHVLQHKKGDKKLLMKENDFFAAVFTSEMKLNYPWLLDHQHHTFNQKSFNALAEKKMESQTHRQSLLLYFMSHPPVIDALDKNCRTFLSERISCMRQDRYREGTKQWIHQLHLTREDPLRKYLEGDSLTVSTIQLYSRRMAWMLLDALCTVPNDLRLLYQKYSSASGQSSASIDSLKCTSGLRRLYNHAVTALHEKDSEKRNAGFFSLGQEFSRLRIMYQQSQASFSEKYRKLYQDALNYFHQFLSDLEKKSSTTCLNLDLMKKNLEKLEEL